MFRGFRRYDRRIPIPPPEDATEASLEPVASLRGAGVDVDLRRVGRVAAALLLLALAMLAVGLLVSGARKNAQIDALRAHGVPVEVVTTTCLGLMGGSGSNAAGRACDGTFTLGGQHYTVAIPGNGSHAPGETVRLVADSANPSLVSTYALLASEHSSWRVFIAPVCLFAVLALGGGALWFRRRSRPAR